MNDADLTRDIETREESYALSAAAELIADEYHDDTKGGEWTSEIRWAVRKAWIAGRNWERRQQTDQNEAAILEVERSTERWTTLTRARQADKTEIERFIGLNAALATEIERLRGLLREAKSVIFGTLHPQMDGSERQAAQDFLAKPLGI